jgi:hypothetical protein
MSTFQLDKLLYQLSANPDTFAAFTSAPDSVLDRYELTDAERSAVLDRNLGALTELGANGYLTVGFAAHLGIYRGARATAAANGGH